MVADGPISEGGGKSDNSGCGIVFGLVFACVGIGVLISAVASALFALDATTWQETPCKILTANLDESHSDDGTTYRADFTYSYEFDGQNYVGDRDSVTENFGSRKAAQKLLKSLPVGTEAVCHVDPNEPSESVLDATFPAWYVLWMSLFGLAFGGVGSAIAYASFKSRQAEKKRRAEQLGVIDRAEALSGSGEYFQTDVIDRDGDQGHSLQTSQFSGALKSARGRGGPAVHPADLVDRRADVPQKAKAESSRLGTLVGVTLIALFWNGIVSVFVFGMINDAPGGWMSLFIGLFLVPFVLIGLGLIAAVFHSFVSLFNPKVSIALSTGAVARGGEIDIAWEVSGGIRSIDRLQIAVVGTEWARYQRGTDTIVDESTFEVVPVISTADATEIRFGSATVTIPQESMHTLDRKNNKIKWAVVASGEIAWWPDVLGNFPFRVMPRPQSSDHITLTTTAGLNDE
jgi:hypothetical protein